MKTINLKDYYAHVIEDTYIDIPDEVFDIFEEHRKAEQAYQSKVDIAKAEGTSNFHCHHTEIKSPISRDFTSLTL